MRLTTFVLVVGHLLLGAVWLGAMSYSIAVVQPRLLRYGSDPAEGEDLATTVAAGARWKVVGLIAALTVTGAGLVVLAPDRPGVWWLLVGLKVLATAAASGLFWYVSWRMWPRRVFALPSEVPRWQAAFRRVGWAMLGLAGAATVGGVALRFVT